MKKVLSLVLASVLVVGMSSVAFGAKKDRWNEKFAVETVGLGTSGIKGERGSDNYRPDDEIIVPLVSQSGVAITRQMVRDGKLDIQVRSTEGSAALDKAKLEYTNGNLAQVKISLVDEYVSTKELDFNFEIYVTADKSRNDFGLKGAARSPYILTGTLENDITYVSEGDDYVYIGDDHVVKAEDYIRNIKVDLGQGFSITTKMFDGKKYYGSVSQEVKAEDEATLAKYPSIDSVYYVKTIGLNSTGDTVQFDLENNYYVYVPDEDGNLVYLGRSNDKLAYYTKYFLSTKELDVEVAEPGDDILEPDGNDDIQPNPGTGGDDAPSNINDNPGTGR